MCQAKIFTFNWEPCDVVNMGVRFFVKYYAHRDA